MTQWASSRVRRCRSSRSGYRKVRGSLFDLCIVKLCRNGCHRPRRRQFPLCALLEFMQTIDDERRWFAGDAWKARAIAFTTRRMTAKARWDVGARTHLGKLLASHHQRLRRWLGTGCKRWMLLRKKLREFAHVTVGKIVCDRLHDGT